MIFMRYDFNIDNGTITIRDLELGKDWSNHLFNKIGYITSVTHYGATYSRFLDKNAVLVNYNNQVSVLYLRDAATKKYWNIGGYPSMNEIDDFSCTHGQNYSLISSVANGIRASIEYLVCPNDTREIWKVTLKNVTRNEREIDLFAATSFDLGGFSQPFYYNMPTTSATEFIKEANGLFCENKNPFRPHDNCSGYILSSSPVTYYDGNYEKFIGSVGSSTKPYILERGLNCTNSTATVRLRGGVLQNRVILKAGEQKTVYYVLGLTTGKENVIRRYANIATECEEIVAETDSERPYGSIRVNCPEPQINRVMNFWAEHQVRYCMLGKKAVRDNAQLAMAMLNCDVNRARESIEECIVHQYSDGHSVLLWYPIVEKTIYSDPSAWLVFAICEYVKESGDISYLNKKLAYLDGGEGSVYEHLKKAVEWFSAEKNSGEHGLPKIYHADWNDALNIPDDNAESVLMAMLVCKVYKEIADLARYIGDNDYASHVENNYRSLKQITNEVAFNGDYYVRAFSKFGVVGDKNCPDGGKIYVNPQSWSILSGVCPDKYLDKVCDSIDAMETADGLPMCAPPYSVYDEHVGRMSGMLPGVYENGGIYNHAGCFKVMADCRIGHGEKAVNTLLKILPDGKNNPSEKTTAEPYVFTNCYLKHPSVDMMVGFSWQTGTSAWGIMCVYEGVLGLKREYEGLTVLPNFPSTWKSVTAERTFRGNRLHITYENENRGNIKLFIDGKEIEGVIIPPFKDNDDHYIICRT